MNEIPAHIVKTLEEFAKRRRHDTAVIKGIAIAVGVDPALWLLDETNTASSDTPAAARETKAAARDTKRGNGEPARPPDAPSKQGDRILAALKAHGSPMSPGELATKLDLNRYAVQNSLRTLRKAGLVLATGTTNNRRISLS